MDVIYNEPLKYKDICEIFNEAPVKTGAKGRSLQLRKWQQYYDIEKIGIYYFIKKKYNDMELDLIENSGKYTSYITDKLIDYLTTINRNEITLSFYDIYEITTMVNDKYHKGKNNLHNKDKVLEIEKFNLNIGNYLKDSLNTNNEKVISTSLYVFFKVSNKLLRQNVYNALKSMQRRGLIIYHDSFILYKKPVKTDNGELICYPPHVCNNKEISKILDFKAESLRHVGLKEFKELYCSNISIQNEYYGYLLGLIKKEFGYDSYTNAVKLILGNKALEHELKFNKSNKLNQNTQMQMLESKEMGQKILHYLNQQFTNEYIKK